MSPAVSAQSTWAATHRWSAGFHLHACAAQVDELVRAAQHRVPVLGQHLRAPVWWPAGACRDPGGDLAGAGQATVRLERGAGGVYQRLDHLRPSGRGPASRMPESGERRERSPSPAPGRATSISARWRARHSCSRRREAGNRPRPTPRSCQPAAQPPVAELDAGPSLPVPVRAGRSQPRRGSRRGPSAISKRTSHRTPDWKQPLAAASVF